MSLNKSSSLIGGLSWTFAERITAQIVSTLVGIILARLLSPEDYGAISIVMIFITLCNVFVTSGFGQAIVQKKSANEEDYNTAFILSFFISILLYLLLYILAPYIAEFYSMQVLKPVIRVLGLRLIVTSLNTIQQSYIQRTMQFKKFFIATIFGTVISCFVGLTLAYKGFGVWALVAQYLTNTTIDTLVLAFVGGWNPKWNFSMDKAKEIFSFGWKVLCTELTFTLEGDLRSLIIGKAFSSADLAYYDQGKKYQAVFVNNLNAALQKVLLSVLSRQQEEIQKMKHTVRTCVNVGMFVLAPLMVGFAAVSDKFVSAVLTDKWLPTVPYIIIFCLYYLTRPIETACHQALLALGKVGLVFKIMVIIQPVSIIGTIIGTFAFRSVISIAVLSLFSTLVSLFCFLKSTNIYLNYKLKEQLSDIVPAISIAFIMGVIVFTVGRFIDSPWVSLCIQLIVGLMMYSMLAWITKNTALTYIKNKIMERIARL